MNNPTNTTAARFAVLATACPVCGAKAGRKCNAEDRDVKGLIPTHGQKVPTWARDFHPARYVAALPRVTKLG